VPTIPSKIAKDEERSPFGRKIEASERKKLEPNNPRGLFEYVKEHPAQIGLGLLAAPLIPEGLVGIGAGTLLGGVGRSIDKLHPLTKEENDYKTKTALSNTADIGLNAIGSGLLQGIFGKAVGSVTKEVPPVIKTGFSPPSKTGFVPPKSTSELAPIERNAGNVYEIVKEAGPRAPDIHEMIVRESPADFAEDFVKTLWKDLTFQPPKPLPKGPKFGLPPGTEKFGTPPNPAKFLDERFLR
jgi:hypothetical protein